MSESRANAQRAWRAGAVAALAALAGCGFHLQGSGNLPSALARTYVDNGDRRSVFVDSLNDALRLRGAEIVPETEAGAVLSIVSDETGQRVLSVTARNIPREYEIYYAVTFTLRVAGQELLAPQSLVATRAYTYDETEVLAKAAEEQILRRALADDLARQVLKRIEAADPRAAPRG